MCDGFTCHPRRCKANTRFGPGRSRFRTDLSVRAASARAFALALGRAVPPLFCTWRLRALLHLLWVALCRRYFARGDKTRNCGRGALLEVVVAKVLHAFALAARATGQVTPRIRAHLLL